jgi:putative RecB family exonuclease
MTINIDHLSVSNLSSFVKCPRAWKFNYLDRVPREENKYAVVGKAIHWGFEKWGLCKMAGSTYEKLEMIVEVEMYCKDAGYWNDEISGQIRICVDAFYCDLPHDVFAVEEEFNIVLEEGMPPINGFIDRIDLLENGEYRIVDYKTGKVPRPQWFNDNFQLETYALYVQEKYGKLPAQAQFHYVGQGRTKNRPFKIVSQDITEETVAIARNKMIGIWHEIKESDFPCGKFDNSFFCNVYCQYGTGHAKLCDPLLEGWKRKL